MFYRFKNDIVNINNIHTLSKKDVCTPFSKEGKDDWEKSGRFLIMVDDAEYEYDSASDRDCVFNDVVSKIANLDGGCMLPSDRQALANCM